MSSYRDILAKVRLSFPSPVSDRVHDSYFVHSVMLAMDKVDALKSNRPILGDYTALDYEAALDSTLNTQGLSIEEVTSDLVSYCKGLTIPGHPRTHHNVIPPPTIASLIATLVTSVYNPNIVWDEYSHRVALAEVEITAMLSKLIGYDSQHSGGLFTFGGTGTTLYGMKVGLEKAIPAANNHGIREDVTLIGSSASHYCRYNVASWLGIGAGNLITVNADARNSMCLDELRTKLHEALSSGAKVAGIVATMGTTDAFGVDDLATIVKIRDEMVEEFQLPYRIHVHADAVIGWAWSVFNDYDFDNNPLGFRPRTLRMLATARRDIRHLHLADSVGFDFHKSGFTPYTSSMVLFKERNDLSLLSRSQKQMPYLYQFGAYRPGMYTLESSRGGSGVMAAFASLKLLGKLGFQTLIGHLVEMTQLLREHLVGQDSVAILNRDNVGSVTVFRVYPDADDVLRLREAENNNADYRDKLLQHNEYNRAVFKWVHDEVMAARGGGVLSLTDCYQMTNYGEPMLGLKSFIMSPFLEEDMIKTMVEKISAARKNIPATREEDKQAG